MAEFKSKMFVVKRDGRKQEVHFDKITARIGKLAYGLNPDFCDPVSCWIASQCAQPKPAACSRPSQQCLPPAPRCPCPETWKLDRCSNCAPVCLTLAPTPRALRSPRHNATQILVAQKVTSGVYKGVTTSELDELAAETAAALTSTHPDYAVVSGDACTAAAVSSPATSTLSSR